MTKYLEGIYKWAWVEDDKLGLIYRWCCFGPWVDIERINPSRINR